MTTRREFVSKAAALTGIAFMGCDGLPAARAQAPRRREVVVSGHRVKTVDVHAHCGVPEAMALMGLTLAPASLVMASERIRRMDEQGIDVEALSINPYWYAAELKSRLRGNGGLENTIGNPLETTLALSHLIFEGTLDRFPGLKICAAHGGGYLPSYAPRSDHICLAFPERCAAVPLKKRPAEYLKQLYFDSIVFTPEALRHLAAQVGSSQIVLGTDYPYPWTQTAVEHILATPGLSDAERAAMLGGTAAKLLGINA